MKPYEWMKEGGGPYGGSPEKEREEEEELANHEADFQVEPNARNIEGIMHYCAYTGKREKLYEYGAKIIEYTKATIKEDEIDFFIATDVYEYYGIFHYYANEPKEAIEYFLKVFDAYPEHPSLLEYLIAAFVSNGDYEIAKEHIEKFVAEEIAENEQKGSYINTHLFLEFGKFYESVGMYDDALKIFLLVKKLSTSVYHDYYFDLSHIYYKLHDRGQAVENMKKYVELRPKDHEGWGWLALYAYEHEHDAEVAEYYSLKCLELSKNEKEGYSSWEESIHRNLSIFFANADDFDKAFHYLKEKFRGKYGEQAGEWIEMLDRIPLDQDPDEIRNMFQSIMEFEASDFASDGIIMEFVFKEEDTTTTESQIKPADISALLDIGSISDN